MQTMKHFRPAIAMIEFIFALVIMGIALMSAPMLITTATSTTNVALQQEGINEAASRIAMIMTYPWDENDLNDSCIPPVLRANGDGNLNESGTTGRRIGVPLASGSRTFLCGGQRYDASPIGADGGDLDDIDDFDNPNGILQEIDAALPGEGNYIETDTVKIATNIYYAADTATYNSATINYQLPDTEAGSTTNIKAISVELTSTSSVSEFDKKITLRGFSCNIGGMEFEKRTF